jgi:hypothetical protein
MKDLLPYIVDKIEKYKFKHEIHSFDSGAVMVDIWIDECFYVIQIDRDTIGLSLVTNETTLFDIIPDNSFVNINEFKKAFENIIPKV